MRRKRSRPASGPPATPMSRDAWRGRYTVILSAFRASSLQIEVASRMPEANDLVIVLLVVGARLLVPLAIPKFPLPAGIAAVVSDFLDGTLYEAFANVGLT